MGLRVRVLAEELLDTGLVRDELTLELALDGLNLTLHCLFLQQRPVEQPRLHVEGLLQGVIVDLELVVCELILGICVAIATVRRDVVAKGAFIRVLLTAHEDHVLQEVRQALPVRGVIMAPDIDRERAVGHATFRGCQDLIVVLDEEDLDSVGQVDNLVPVPVSRRLLNHAVMKIYYLPSICP